MNITEITNKVIKLSARSITCKNEEGKTCGVVRNTELFKNFAPRTASEFFSIIRKSGIWGHSEFVQNLVCCDGKLYYLHDLRPLESYKKYFEGREGFESETEFYNLRLETARKAAEYMTVIPCYISR